MGDGSGGIGKSLADTAANIGKDMTVNLAKDIFEQATGGGKTNQKQSTQGSQQIQNVQKNLQMVNLSRRIQMFKQQRAIAEKQQKQKEQEHKQRTDEKLGGDERKQRYENPAEKKKSKMSDIFSNFSSKLARRGKGEQRGNKASG